MSPDDHLATLRWAFDEFMASDASRRQTIRYYAALLDAEAGRQAKARQDLAALRTELASSPGSLLDAVEAALNRLALTRHPLARASVFSPPGSFCWPVGAPSKSV